MNTPNIRYYAKLVNTTQNGKKTPKFTLIMQAGYYLPTSGEIQSVASDKISHSRVC